MATLLLDDLLEDLSTEQRGVFIGDYREIRSLPRAATSLQDFLDTYLTRLVSLYAATAGAIWFRSPEGAAVTSRARRGLDNLGLDGEFTEPHQRLLQFALSRPRSFLVRPFAAPTARAPVSNPTDSFVVLGPVDHQGDRIAVVELFLGPTPLRGRTAGDRNRYVLWLDHLLTFLCRGIEWRLLRTAAPLHAATEGLATVQVEIEAMQQQIRDTLQQRLTQFTGWNFGSLELNQAFTAQLHELLDQYGLRVTCPVCQAPAILRCQNSGNARTGVFMFDHYLETGRTFHGGPTTVPAIQLAAKPARRKSLPRDMSGPASPLAQSSGRKSH